MNPNTHRTKNINRLNYKGLRNEYFPKFFEVNPSLLEILKLKDTHKYLSNPACMNIYAYLTNYIKNLTQQYFTKSFKDVKILDWGCGRGQNTYLLRELGANIISCDLVSDEDWSAYGQETPIIDHFDIEVTPLTHPYKLPFADNSFDVVLSFGVLEHVSHDSESLKEINRILKNDGLLLCFFLPYFLSWTQFLSKLLGNFYHDKLYSKSQVYKLLDDSNFDLMDIWHRQLLPKNSIYYPNYKLFEKIDQFLTNYTPFHYFVTNIEFVASKIAKI